jgi:3-deoxy-D-manno-octulosonic-acid transferase
MGAAILRPVMLTAIYNSLWYAATPFALLAGRSTRRGNLRERLGQVETADDLDGGIRIWIHAASVGEVEAVRPVVQGLIREFPSISAVITTMTTAGRSAARQRIPSATAWLLAPLDCPLAVRRFLGAVRPRVVLIAETELWPNFFIGAARIGAKVAIVNGRISTRSMRRYRLVRPLFRHALAQVDMILAQSAEDAARYASLGAPANRIFVTGNTKFDLDASPAKLRPALERFAAGRPILVAGSTAPGEERMVLAAYRNLGERFPSLALVLAPRHLDRTSEVEEQLRQTGLKYVKASAMPASVGQPSSEDESALLLDTMGELRGLYRRATLVFVGGSMTPLRGGQSLSEPAAAAVPVIFGPYYESQRVIGDALVEAGASRVVNDAAQLESTCAEWLADAAACRAAGAAARNVVERLAGGTASTLRHLRTLVEAAPR